MNEKQIKAGTKISYVFMMPKANEQVKIHAITAEDSSKQDLADQADQLFIDAMKHAGKTMAEINQADYILAIVKGWC